MKHVNLIQWLCLLGFPGSSEIKRLIFFTVCVCVFVFMCVFFSLSRSEVYRHWKRVDESRTMCIWLRFHWPSGWRRGGWGLQSVSIKSLLQACTPFTLIAVNMLASCLYEHPGNFFVKVSVAMSPGRTNISI